MDIEGGIPGFGNGFFVVEVFPFWWFLKCALCVRVLISAFWVKA